MPGHLCHQWAEAGVPTSSWERRFGAHVITEMLLCSQTGTENALPLSLVCTLLYEVAVIELDKIYANLKRQMFYI